MNEELMSFIKWLPEHVELFKGLTTEETVSKINDLSASEEGKETIKQLTKQYKNIEMGIFKEGGKLNYLMCLKKGGSIKDCGCGNKIEKNAGGNKVGIKDTVHTMQLPNGNTYELSGYSPNVEGNWRNSKERILDPNGNVLGERNIAYGDTLNVSNVGGNPERLNSGFDRLKEQTLRRYYDPARVDMWKRNQTLQEGGTVDELPRYAKIVEGGGPYAKPRRIYYSDDKNNFTPVDGMVMSHEEVVNPWGYWNNEVPVEYAAPTYSVFVEQSNGMNLQPASWIDREKATKETSDKIKKIRKKK